MNNRILFGVVVFISITVHSMERLNPGTYNSGKLNVRFHKKNDTIPAVSKNEPQAPKKRWLEKFYRSNGAYVVVLDKARSENT